MNENMKEERGIEQLIRKKISQYPITSSSIIYPKLSSLILLFLHSLALLMPSVMILTFFDIAMNSNFLHWRILLFFIDILAWWGLYLLSSLLFVKLSLIMLKLIHKPKEGIFCVSFDDPDYYFFCLRVTVKKFAFWIWNNFCFPWVSNFAFRVCDIRADFKSTLFDGWSDAEFIEYGNNMMLGQGAVVQSSMIIEDYLIVKKVIIGDHVVLGGNCIVAPGTVIGKSCTLGVWAVTHINQQLEQNWIYVGRPARKYKKVTEGERKRKSQILSRIVDTGVRKKVNKITKN